jgi:hypothetical protein
MTTETTETSQPGNPEPEPFQYKLITPYSTRIDGKPVPVPYVIHGLLIAGGLSSLAAKPKMGKSSLSRAEAVAIAKGEPFLGRQTVRGESILFSLEDPGFHVDNCLEGLGYDGKTDEKIYIIDRLPASVDESISALDDLLKTLPNVVLVVIDTLAKFIHVPDLNDYMPVQAQLVKLHGLVRKYPLVHIQLLAHCKKALRAQRRCYPAKADSN